MASLPSYVLGITRGSGEPGRLQTNVSVYAPAGAALDALELGDGSFVSGVTATTDGRKVQVVTSQLDPGGTATYRFQVPVHDGQVRVWTTPTLSSPGFITAGCPQP